MSTPHDSQRNEHALRRRFERALADLGLASVIPPAALQVGSSGFTLGSLSVRQLTLLTNVLEDAASRHTTTDAEVTPFVLGLTQPDRLPVSFTAARISSMASHS